MITNCLLNRIARLKKRGGFTLVELLVVIAIIAILAGVALGPITNGIKQAKHNAAMQQARTVGQVCFNYATDNTTGGNRYPGGTAASAIATTLVTTGYATDASIFVVSGQQSVTASTTSALTSGQVSWTFTVDTDGSQGLSTTAGDTTPIVAFNKTPATAAFAFPGTANTSADATVTSASPQGLDGIAVYYKGNNASYIKASTVTAGLCTGIVPSTDGDANKYIPLAN